MGGGLGVAPLPFLADALQLRGMSFEAMLGARTAAELWGQKELQRQSDIPPAGESNVFLATDDGSTGHRGFVTEILEARLRHDDSKRSAVQVYACGPMPMLRRVAAICKEAQVSAQIAVETMMGCGFGICMGCPVEPSQGVAQFGRYWLACLDGPVFQADEIRYESFAH